MMTRHSRTRSRTTLAALVLTPLLLVAACGGDPAPAPTTPQAGKTSSGSGGPTVESPSGGDLCPSVDNLRDDTITSYASFGDIVGFDDEVAERVGTTWRHSIPVTLTNPISAQCMIQVGITVTGSGGSYMEDSVVAVLDAGASVNIQAFALEREFEFESDTKDASPTEDLDIKVSWVQTSPVYDYYDADLKVEPLTGEGGDTLLPVSVVKRGTNDGMPKAFGIMSTDFLYVVGLDASGTVVASFYTSQAEFINSGETGTINLPATYAGAWNGGGKAFQGLAALEDVAEYKVVAYQPNAMQPDA